MDVNEIFAHKIEELQKNDNSVKEAPAYCLRGAITKKKRENLGKIPKGGGDKFIRSCWSDQVGWSRRFYQVD